MQLLIDHHLSGNRQGPGSEKETRRAMQLAGLYEQAGVPLSGVETLSTPTAPTAPPATPDTTAATTAPALPLTAPSPKTRLKIVDIGCGTGASSLQLATELGADVTAVDNLPDFLSELERRAQEQGLSDRFTTLNASMDDLPFQDGEFDVIWSEAAIYNIGFEKGITTWSRYLKPGGMLVVSEISWRTASRPAEIQSFWEQAYPEIDLTSAKLATLERCGFSPLAWFILPDECWMQEYYTPLQARRDAFLARHAHNPDRRRIAEAIIEEDKTEIDLYRRFGDTYGYGFYVTRKG